MAAIILVGNSNNILSSAVDTTANTLKISNCTAFDLEAQSLVRLYDVTTSTEIPLNRGQITCVKSLVSGLPVFTYTFAQSFPAGTANSDTFYVFLDIPAMFMNFLALQKIAGATI